MDRLMKELAKAGVQIDRSVVEARLKELGATDADLTPQVVKELVAEFAGESVRTVDVKAILSAPAPQSEQKRPATSGGRAKQTIANVATRRDAAVADVLEMAQSEADKRTAAKKQELAARLGAQMASSEIQAIEEVADFFLRTLGNSQWLLSGAQGILEGELVD